MKQFYVYLFFDPRNEEPFYVGKGFGWRYKRHLGNHCVNKHLKNRIKAIRANGLEPIVTKVNVSNEQEALLLEIEFISVFGRRDLNTGSLCNYTDGGDGSMGRRGILHSEETKARIREKMLGRIMTKEHRDRIGAARKGHVNNPESLARASATRLANLDDAARKKLSDAGKKCMTPEHQKRMTEAARIKNTGSKNSEDTKRKKSLASKGRVPNATTRLKMGASQKRRFERERLQNVGN